MSAVVDVASQEERAPLTGTSASCDSLGDAGASAVPVHSRIPSATDLPKSAVCRICLEEDSLENMDQPCSCSGTMKHTHHECLQRWIQEKGDKICEICKRPFSGEYEEPTTPGLRPEHITVWGQDFLVMTDPETGAIRAQRLQGFNEEDDGNEDDRLHTGTAWCFTAVLLVLCLLLVKHLVTLFTLSSSSSAGGQKFPDKQAQTPEEQDGAFEDLSVTLLVLWLLMRMLVMVAPVYAVMRFAAGWSGGLQRFGGRGSGREVNEVELEQRLDQVIQRMETGAGITSAGTMQTDRRTTEDALHNVDRAR